MKVKLPNLHKWQKDLVDAYLQHTTGKWFVVKSPRQVGKSISIEYLLVYASLGEKNSVSIAISPTIGQARKLYNDIVLFAGKLISKSNGSLLYIEFVNGSTIHFKSAEQGDSVRGFTTKRSGILCVDEAAFIDSDFFYNICVPITNVYKSDIFLFSTPKYKQGLFYELYTKGGDGHIISFDWTEYDLSKYLTPELLELYREQLPKAAFTSEYLAEFIDGDGAVFTDFKQCVGEVPLDKQLPVYFSVDWGTGTGSDDTVITIGQFADKMIVHKQYYFNDKKTNDTIDYILDLIKMYIRKGIKEINVVVEHNSIGQVYFDVLFDKVDIFEEEYNAKVNYSEEIEISLQQFTTTNKSKKRIVERLETLFENNEIIIPNDAKLLSQLSMFEANVNDKGTVTYKGANNSHDDLVMSLCFLTEYLSD